VNRFINYLRKTVFKYFLVNKKVNCLEKKYIIAEPPLGLNPSYRNTTLEQAKSNYEWYINKLTERIEVLAHYIQSYEKYKIWVADYSPNSLDELGKWFYEYTETRQRSSKEIEEIYAISPKWFKAIEIPDYDLSNITLSFCIDISMYFSQILLNEIPELHWELCKSKSRIHNDYHQPVLVGQGKLVCNPLDLIITLAYGYSNKSKRPERLKELYVIWKDILIDY
jgi:hypothetical protein